ncbi:hypothetical protein GH811_04725 [Acetobacterium malicum]|uniref:Uncharacterized protein n=1 Tax=Acetobacterium malicum TaxID=52692 RepID=A0ABR6YUP9_9FIRM|nr:hypothetical protein [Acetobacterium malicum]MBC3898916.1 hypothetical protein [Acetobacterium malicum]
MELNKIRQSGEIVIAKSRKRRGFEGVEKGTNSLTKASEGMEGVFSKLRSSEQKIINEPDRLFLAANPFNPFIKEPAAKNIHGQQGAAKECWLTRMVGTVIN